MGKNLEHSLHNDEEEELDETEFIVEKILDRKVVHGEVFYLLKWKGFTDHENSWEPENNLDCPELISDFHKRNSNKSAKRSHDAIQHESNTSSNGNHSTNSSSKKSVRSSSLPDQQETIESSKKAKNANDFGYGRGLEIEKILGATDAYGELMFLIKWQTVEKPELVPARIVNIKSPQQVIRFYEERLTWATTDENASVQQDRQ